ncbi:hypothetical protein [Rhizobium sp.]
MMGLETGGIIGAIAGLLVAAFGNIVMLPWVLRLQRQRYDSGWKPLIGKPHPELKASMTRFQYRIVMPVLFGFVGYQFGTTFFTGAK